MLFTDVWIKTAVDPAQCNKQSSACGVSADGTTCQGSAVLSVALAVRIAVAATNADNVAAGQDEGSPTTSGH
jgi:hypothetical protein